MARVPLTLVRGPRAALMSAQLELFASGAEHVVLAALAPHVGREAGISASGLARDLSMTERDVRLAVETLRRDGHHVCATPQTGYFLAASDEELIETCQFLYRRAMCSLTQVAAMRKVSLPDLAGQLRLPT